MLMLMLVDDVKDVKDERPTSVQAVAL